MPNTTRNSAVITHETIRKVIADNTGLDANSDNVDDAAHQIGRMMITAMRQSLFGYAVREKGTDGPWHLMQHPGSIQQIEAGLSAYSDEEVWDVKPVYL